MTEQAEQKTSKRKIAALFAPYGTDARDATGQPAEGVRTARRGDEVELTPEDEARLEGLGALEPKGGPVEPGQAAGDAARRAVESVSTRPEGTAGSQPSIDVSPPPLGAAPQGGILEGVKEGTPAEPPPELGVESPRGVVRADAPPIESAGADEIAEWIRSEKPNASDTVALAEDDPVLARKVLEAEQAAHGGDGRATVVAPLEKIADDE